MRSFLRGENIKNIANIVTFSRIIFSVAFVFSSYFSPIFWMCYIWCGVSDVLDGFIARRLHCESNFGASLDSLSDLIFAFCLVSVIFLNVEFLFYIWIFIAFIALIKFASYFIGYMKYKKISALHTYLNKLVGFMLFLFPFMNYLLNCNIVALCLCFIALFACLEEMIIICTSRELDLNKRGLFFKK